MTSLQITLSEEMREFLEDEASRGAYGSTTEYLHHLIEEEQERQALRDLEEKLSEALASPAEEMTAADWQSMRDALSASR